PRKDVFRRVLIALNPEAFQRCFHAWISGLAEDARKSTGVGRPVFSVDGKTARRSHDQAKGMKALHAVSVWAGDYGLTLAQTACEEKSNEITAIPEALKLVNCKGAIITIDAMGCQKAIANQIVEQGGDYVLALKGNHEKLHHAVKEYVDAQLDDDFKSIPARRHMTEETGHGREERRIYVQMPLPKEIVSQHEWTGLKTIGVAMLTTVKNKKTTSDVRYFISSLTMGVKEFARSVRGHWAIENSCHWILDMVFREDESRIRQEWIRESFAWLNKFTLSLLKQHPAKQSIAMKRRRCAWNEDFLWEVLTNSVA
ncbi:ISAs1 family transposase, partial [Rubinisphaera sp.]|uniref:ISAs1 family transposase n=1 Tax=Rubinisphaera sp. TaxID=2024857 RepID=UPI0025E6E40D